jgi:uncharacterized iron-regulated membrane protein
MILYNKGEEKANIFVGKAPSPGRTNHRLICPPLKGEALRRPQVNVDRLSRRVVDDSVRQHRHRIVSFLEGLHNELLSGSTGERVNAIGGGLLFFMSLTGIVLEVARAQELETSPDCPLDSPPATGEF